MTELQTLGALSKKASYFLGRQNTEYKNKMLISIADYLKKEAAYIEEENKKDLQKARENGISEAMQDRLLFDTKRIVSCADAVIKVTELPDPIGEVMETFNRPNGLTVEKVRVPMGVVGTIYESRPNVTVDTAVLCLKASNAVILRGGKEAINTNTAIVSVKKKALKAMGADENVIGFVTDTSRDSAYEMMKLKGYIDVLIPRGGAGLINAVVNNSVVPVIETGVGNCHTYVDKYADIKKAVDIAANAKLSRPSVCNAMETLLIHEDIAEDFCKAIDEKFREKNVKIYASKDLLDKLTCVREATDEDFATEFLDYELSVKTVKDVHEAIDHITKYTTLHSECIVTEDRETADIFTACVDAAAV